MFARFAYWLRNAPLPFGAELLPPIPPPRCLLCLWGEREEARVRRQPQAGRLRRRAEGGGEEKVEQRQRAPVTAACGAAAREHLPAVLHPGVEGSHSTMMNADMDDLSARVDAVKEENLKLKSENQVLGQYIENLMSASSVFQTTDTKSKRKYAVKTERTFEKNFGAIERPNNRTLY
ncbi:short coiled-coil protein isoform X4 [Pelodiscus sinensis]|uniref:short coiled-coil protein isoform X4 n=1 Tax=Pelodiscus sinensis TaxID=13735 RepID=UPI003F6CE10C